MGRASCCSKVGLNRGPWNIEEDRLLSHYIQTHGEGQWRALPSKAGLLRCGKSCRLRWVNYLRPGVKLGNFTSDENDTIIRLHSLHGNRWSLIATKVPGRTDNEIKNHWNTRLRKNVLLENARKRTHQPNVVREKNLDCADTSQPRALHGTSNVNLRITPSSEDDDQEKGVKDHAADHNCQSWRFQTSIDNSSMEQTKTESKNVNLVTATSSGTSYSSSTVTEGEVNMETDTIFNQLDDLLDVNQNMDGCDSLSRDDDSSEQLERLYMEYLQLINYGGE